MSIRRSSTDALLVCLHWFAVAAVLTSILTGFRIGADDPSATLTRLIGTVMPTGGVHVIHAWSGFAIFCISIAYYAYVQFDGLFSNLKIRRSPAGKSNPRLAWKRRNTLVYYFLFLLVALLALSGALLYADLTLPAFLPASALVTVHLGLAWTLLGAMLLHVFAQYSFGATAGRTALERVRYGADWLLKMVRPSFRGWRSASKLQTHPITVAVSVGAALLAGGGVMALDRFAFRNVPLVRIASDTAPLLDGAADDAAWSDRSTIGVMTREGANLPDGASFVEVQAAYDAENIYFKFRWQDPTRSLKHLPLQKTANGWRLMHEKYDIEDEDAYYEDKFAILLSTSAHIGGGATHLGPKPLSDKPAPLSGRGLHYTTDGTVADMWQWKSVRSQPLGKLDDDSFGPPAEPKEAEIAGTSRYKGGYVTDPGDIASKNNFAHEGPGGYRGEVVPTRLPTDLASLQRRLGPIDLDPEVGDREPLAMTNAESADYSATLDAAIPVSTVIPGVLIGDGGVDADRGDVRTGARWEDGWWTLETQRKLDTGSDKDIAFGPGRVVYLWVSVFDHSQTRHSRHMRPLAIRIPEAGGAA